MEIGSRDDFFMVGIGASAGGLESLEKLFRAVPDHPGVAFLVVQHLSPEHKSLMPELMARFTRIPILDATDGMQIQVDHIYLLPPGREVELSGETLRVFNRSADRTMSFPIDRMLNSLAEQFGSRSIGVILSGSGSDGSRGVRAVAAKGGLVLVESPETAGFDGMPRSAVETGITDATLSPALIARAILEHADAADAPSREEEQHLHEIISLMDERLGMNFRQYKRGTILRRTRRRMQLSAEASIEKYAMRLLEDKEELAALQRDLLIGVTSFFRDPAVFRILEDAVAAMLKDVIEPERELRAWVAGCATGEEAYSVAIVLAEAIERSGLKRGFKIFATDLHGGAIESASSGTYDSARVKGVDAHRLARWFTPRANGSFQIATELRQRVVLAHHDLLVDTPFTNIDLVTCRNMLIYFKPQAQRRALASLCYGLRINGLLLLGPSESPGELAQAFVVINEPGRLYRKRSYTRGLVLEELPARVSRRVNGAPRPADRLLPLYDALLDKFMPQGFLLGPNRQLLDSFAGAEKLLQVASRRVTGDFTEMVPSGVRAIIVAGLARAERSGESSRFVTTDWAVPDGTVRKVSITVERFAPVGGDVGYLVWLKDATQPTGFDRDDPIPALTDVQRLNSLELELMQARQNLQTTVEELEASNEELQATNEELIASNEELQSVNEELHSVNEELHSVNAEHQRKIGELSEVNRDIGHLLESIEVATLYLDRDLRIRKYTPEAERLFGLVEHDLGRRLASFNQPLQYPNFMKDVEAVRDGAPRVEAEALAQGGQWYFMRLLPYRVADKIEGVVITMTNATALAAARARARHLSAIVEFSGDAIIALDTEGKVLSWNAAATRLYGYTGDEMIGNNVSIIVPPEDRASFQALLQEIGRGSDLVNVATTRIAKSGARLEIAKTMSPVRDASGQITGIATIDRNIHQQKLLERRLRDSEQRYMDLWNHTPDMHLSVDARTGRILECNDTFVRVTGLSYEEAMACDIFELYEADHLEDARQALTAVRGGNRVNEVALSLKRKAMPSLPVTLSATPVYDAQGRVVSTRSVLRDVSERREAEAKLKEAGRLREQFVAMVSHELRSPLHAINAAFQIIDSLAAQPEQRERSQAVVRRQMGRMVRLVDDLLDISRMLNGKLNLERAPLDLAAVVRCAADASAPAFHERGIRLLVDGTERPMPLFGDEGRLEQVITNLLQNALRATPTGRRVTVSLAEAGALGIITVRDEGHGIAPEDLDKIFGLFTQAAQGLARSEGGLGLGLTIARHIVAAHGGTLLAQSDGVGRGACFTVTVPRQQVAAEVLPRSIQSDGPLHIVVVEDQEDARDSLQMLLELEGHKVNTAADGQEGLEAILQHRPQLGLLDIGLPRLNGFELATRVRQELGSSIWLVAMSGYGQPEDVRKAEAAGFDRHLTKPVDSKRLFAALCELRGKR